MFVLSDFVATHRVISPLWCNGRKSTGLYTGDHVKVKDSLLSYEDVVWKKANGQAGFVDPANLVAITPGREFIGERSDYISIAALRALGETTGDSKSMETLITLARLIDQGVPA